MAAHRILFAQPALKSVHERVANRVIGFRKIQGRTPKLAVVLVGNDPASQIYTDRKGKAAVQVGMKHETIRLPSASTPQEVFSRIQALNQDPEVDGILLQRPLPKGFHEEDLIYWISPEKDVDCFHPENVGRMVLGFPTLRPCTPAGVIELLHHYQIQVAGKTAVVVGRSSIVGKPMATLLLHANATVIQCHSKTRHLSEFSTQADLLVVAAGSPLLIHSKHIKQGAVVVDVGIHRKTDGSLVGDVDFSDVSELTSAITPVPGGVGPMTIAMLLENTITAAERRA